MLRALTLALIMMIAAPFAAQAHDRQPLPRHHHFDHERHHWHRSPPLHYHHHGHRPPPHYHHRHHRY